MARYEIPEEVSAYFVEFFDSEGEEWMGVRELGLFKNAFLALGDANNTLKKAKEKNPELQFRIVEGYSDDENLCLEEYYDMGNQECDARYSQSK